MDFRDSAQEAAWRAEVREFIKESAPDAYRDGSQVAGPVYGRGGDLFQEWRDAVVARGWMAPAWPREYGGIDLSIMQQFIMTEEFSLARSPHPGGRGVSMVGPTIIHHGSDEQKSELLSGTLDGSLIWAQGFSEPGAGSDLASLQLRAVRDGDDYVLNGQKIWTSDATTCNWLFVLARTDPDAPKHRGISYFVTPLDVPGLTISPIVDMTGGGELCETFFEDVRIPARYLLGEENRGWYVAMTTLDFERSGIAGAVGLQLQLRELIDLAHIRARQASLPVRETLKRELADLWIASHAARLMSYNVASMQSRGLVPNREASQVKLFSSEIQVRSANTAVAVLGLQGQVTGADDPWAVKAGRLARYYMGVLPTVIAGGTSEIQRNIIATRGLGLPRA